MSIEEDVSGLLDQFGLHMSAAGMWRMEDKTEAHRALVKAAQVKDRLLSALEDARKPQWLPIEQAPKDGAEVVLRRGDRVSAGSWIEEREVMGSEYHNNGTYLGQYPTGQVVGGCWGSWDGGFTDEEPPTHFMQLPPALGAALPQGKGEV